MLTPRHQMKKLRDLSSVRERLAMQKVAAARNLLRERVAVVENLQRAAEDLARAQADQRRAMRQPILDNPQLRGAIDSIMATFDGDRRREEDAAQKVVEAQRKVADARQELDRARQHLAEIHRQARKRQEICDVLEDAHLRNLARAEEAEQEERRLSLRRKRAAS